MFRDLMKKPLYVGAIAFLVGTVIGLVILGWWLMPVVWTDAGPEDLYEQAKIEYLYMAIEAYGSTKDVTIAEQRYQAVGKDADTLLAKIYANPGGLTLPEISAFANTVGAPDPAKTQGAPSPQKPPKGSSSGLLMIVFIILLAVVFAAALAVYYVQRKKRLESRAVRQASAVTELEQAPSIGMETFEGESKAAPEIGEWQVPLAQEDVLPQEDLQTEPEAFWETETAVKPASQPTSYEEEVRQQETLADEIAMAVLGEEAVRSVPADEPQPAAFHEERLEDERPLEEQLQETAVIAEMQPEAEIIEEEEEESEVNEETVTKFARDLTYIQGIGPAYAAKLKELRITTPLVLFKQGATPKGRQALAEQTGISETLLLKWVNMADLYRIKGIGHQYAELLEAAGVNTVLELAARNPGRLHKALLEVNAEKRLVRYPPKLSSVESWIQQAKKLPRAIAY